MTYNYLQKNAPFKNMCSVHIRLAVTKSSDMWLLNNMNQIYFLNKKLMIYRNNFNLMSAFADILVCNCIHSSLFDPKLIDNALMQGNYIIGMYDAFLHPGDMNFHRHHNYNTFMIYGEKHNKYMVYIGGKPSGMQSELLAFDDLKQMFQSEKTQYPLTETDIEYLGLPLSVLHPLHSDIRMPSLNSIRDSLMIYYNSVQADAGLNAVKGFCCLLPNDFKISNEAGKSYEIVSNISTFYDYKKIHAQKCKVLKHTQLITNHDYILKSILSCRNLFARFIFTQDLKYLKKIKEELQIICLLELENAEIINGVILYDEENEIS